MNHEPRPEHDGGRPPVAVQSLVGAAAGLILLGSLVAFMSELTGDRLRVGGLGLSLIFEAMGVVLLVISNGRRSNTAGVVLTALGVIPLVFLTFFDLDRSKTLVGGDDITITATVALLVAAGLWLVGHFFGPTRSHALFLGAALVAVWLAITIQIVDTNVQRSFDQFGRPAPVATGSLVPAQVDNDIDRRLEEYERYDNGEVVCDGDELVGGDPAFWECIEGDPWPIVDELDDQWSYEEEFVPDEGWFEYDPSGEPIYSDQYMYEEGYGDYGGPYSPFAYSTGWAGAGSRFGWATLVFGLVYLGGGALFDRRGDSRRGTAFFAVSLPLMYYGTAFTGLDAVWRYATAYCLVGTAAAYLGASANRRFTAWAGTVVATGGLAALVIDVVGEDSSGTTIGLTLLVLGLAVALGAHLLDARGPDPDHPSATGPPPFGGDDPGAQATLPAAPPSPPTLPPTAPVAPAESPWAPQPHPGPPRPPQAAPNDPTSTIGPGSPISTPPAFDPRPPGSSDPLPPRTGESF